ncbi:MAG: efflux transporter periplasmic adaptor subunit [Herbaspirillum sp.]|nr:efflux transporter periplasmic adaptor subunit [Herbaspirillum sp.]
MKRISMFASRPVLYGTVSSTLASALLGSVLLSACSKPEPVKSAIQPVLVVSAHSGAASIDRVFPATIQARHESDLSFRTGGKVVSRLVNVGQRVRAGQVLAHLDQNDNALSASAAVDIVSALKAEAAQASLDAARARRLLADGSVSAAEQERLKTQADSLQARLQQAQRQAGVASNRLGYTTLVAPYDGVVTTTHIEAGQIVTEGQVILSIARSDEWEVVADLPEQMLDQARNSDATASLWAHAGTRLKLSLRELSPIANVNARTYRARYSIDDATAIPPSILALGMTAELSLRGQSSASATWLPAGAVWKADGTPSVWLVDAKAGKLLRQAVAIQGYTAEAVEVAGIKEGSLIVAAGVQKLDSSIKVRPVARTSSGLNADGVLPVATDFRTSGTSGMSANAVGG